MASYSTEPTRWPQVGHSLPGQPQGAGELLANRLFLVTHRDLTGRPQMHARAMGLGLAGGLLGELILEGHLLVADGLLRLVGDRSPADALAAATLLRMRSEKMVRDARTWLTFLAGEAEHTVGQRLCWSGLARRQRSGLLRRSFRYVPVDPLAAARLSNRLYLSLTRGEDLTVFDATMAGLVAALGRRDLVVLDAGASAVRRLQEQVAALPASLRELIAQTEAAVGDQVLSHWA